jgi:hypothetical protein
MGHADEYHDAMIAMLELIWGAGFMAPGGEGNVANLVKGLEVRDKRVLDIGCGSAAPPSSSPEPTARTSSALISSGNSSTGRGVAQRSWVSMHAPNSGWWSRGR